MRTISITGTQNGIPFTRSSSIKSRTIYDEQLYSETDDDLLVNLSSSERAAAITSGTGLLWEGLDGARNDCSYGQRMAELKADSAKSQDGKPRIHAPSTYDAGGSVSHTHANTEDVMESLGPTPRNMDLTLGMLKDMGWQVSNDGFPPDCTPTGISVTPTSGLVTSELGGEATFEVVLESEPTEDVVIPVSSTDASEGVTDPEVLELRFTPLNWDTPQEVTVRGIDDDSHDGPQDYEITVGKTQSADRFYDGLDDIQKVSVRNDDDDQPPPPPPTDPTPPAEQQPVDNPQPSNRPLGGTEEGGGGGCAIASGGKTNHDGSALLNLLAVVCVVFPAFLRKNRSIAE